MSTLVLQFSDEPTRMPSLKRLVVRDRMDPSGPTFIALLTPSDLQHLNISALSFTPYPSQSSDATSSTLDDCRLPCLESFILHSFWFSQCPPHNDDHHSLLAGISSLPPLLQVNHHTIRAFSLQNCIMTYSLIDLLSHPQKVVCFPVLNELNLLYSPLSAPSGAPDLDKVIFKALVSRPILSMTMEWFDAGSNPEPFVVSLIERINNKKEIGSDKKG